MELVKLVSKEAFFERVKKYQPENLEFIVKVYNLAEKLHTNTRDRDSGDPYITHPLAVAYMMAENGHFDVVTLAAGLLHDVIEDGSIIDKDIKRKVTSKDIIDELGEKHGPEIAEIVEGVTNLDRELFQGDKNTKRFLARCANLRKLIDGVKKNPKILIVKLYDRLHNMLTLDKKIENVIGVDKRRDKAQETMDYYYFLAKLIGAYDMAENLADLSFKILAPETYEMRRETLEDIKRNSEETMQDILETVTTEMERQEIGLLKKEVIYMSPFSLDKELTVKGEQLYTINNLRVFRLIVDSVQNCYATLGVINTNYPDVKEIASYLEMPKDNLFYRALHTVVSGLRKNRDFNIEDATEKEIAIGKAQALFQGQITTPEFDVIGCYGLQAYWNQGYEGLSRVLEGAIARIQKNIRDFENDAKNSRWTDLEFLQRLAFEMFNENRKMIRTPAGDVIPLPPKGTGVDLAAAVHKSVFGRAQDNMYINGTYEPITTILPEGSSCSIITNPAESPPNPLWKRHAASSTAKRLFKSSLWKSQQRKNNIQNAK